MKVVVNDCEFVVGVSDEVNEFLRVWELCGVVLVLRNIVGESLKIVCKPESDIGGGLNDRLHDLSDVFLLVGEQMIAQDGLLEFLKRESV